MTGIQLRNLRESRNYTRAELAEFLGDCSASAVVKWEGGQNPIPNWVAEKILSSVPVTLPIEDLALLVGEAAKQGVCFSDYLSKIIRGHLEAERKSLDALPASQLMENVLAFPEIPLLHAAAGSPIAADGDHFAPTRDYGPGRFACRLHGDSMAPRYPDGSTVILRERSSLKRPVLKKGEVYLFTVEGASTLKVYDTRKAKKAEIAAGIAYDSTEGGQKVRILRALNPAFPEIVLDPKSDPDWIGWLDGDDQ